MTGRSGRLQGQIVRFLVTGALAFVIDYGILISLTELAGVNYLISAAAGFLAAVLFNYVLSVRWVFRGATVPPPSNFLPQP